MSTDLQSSVRRELWGKATPEVLISLVLFVSGALHLGLLFLAGMVLGPLILWFIDPAPACLPFLSGLVAVSCSFLSALHAGDPYWSTFTYDSKSEGEIPLARRRTCGLPGDMVVFGPNSLHALAKMFSLPLLIGSVLVLRALRGFRIAERFLSADTVYLASLLSFIHLRGGHVSLDELRKVFPGFRLERDVRTLSLLDGVVVLSKEMNGIALAESLEDKIRRRSCPLRKEERTRGDPETWHSWRLFERHARFCAAPVAASLCDAYAAQRRGSNPCVAGSDPRWTVPPGDDSQMLRCFPSNSSVTSGTR